MLRASVACIRCYAENILSHSGKWHRQTNLGENQLLLQNMLCTLGWFWAEYCTSHHYIRKYLLFYNQVESDKPAVMFLSLSEHLWYFSHFAPGCVTLAPGRWHKGSRGYREGLQISHCRVLTALIGSFHNHPLSFHLSLCYSVTAVTTHNIKLCSFLLICF